MPGRLVSVVGLSLPRAQLQRRSKKPLADAPSLTHRCRTARSAEESNEGQPERLDGRKELRPLWVTRKVSSKLEGFHVGVLHPFGPLGNVRRSSGHGAAHPAGAGYLWGTFGAPRKLLIC